MRVVPSYKNVYGSVLALTWLVLPSTAVLSLESPNLLSSRSAMAGNRVDMLMAEVLL